MAIEYAEPRVNVPSDLFDLPEPSEHAISAEAQERAEVAVQEQAEAASVTPPATEVSGTGRRKRKDAGKPRGSRKSQSQVSIPAGAGELPEVDRLKAQAKAAARATVATLIQLGTLLGGDEWAPVRPGSYQTEAGIVEIAVDEESNLVTAWAEYYEAAGITQVPPWVGAAVATGGYVLPRLRRPKTAGKLRAAREWVYAKIGAWRARRAARSSV